MASLVLAAHFRRWRQQEWPHGHLLFGAQTRLQQLRTARQSQARFRTCLGIRNASTRSPLFSLHATHIPIAVLQITVVFILTVFMVYFVNEYVTRVRALHAASMLRVSRKAAMWRASIGLLPLLRVLLRARPRSLPSTMTLLELRVLYTGCIRASHATLAPVNVSGAMRTLLRECMPKVARELRCLFYLPAQLIASAWQASRPSVVAHECQLAFAQISHGTLPSAAQIHEFVQAVCGNHDARVCKCPSMPTWWHVDARTVIAARLSARGKLTTAAHLRVLHAGRWTCVFAIDADARHNTPVGVVKVYAVRPSIAALSQPIVTDVFSCWAGTCVVQRWAGASAAACAHTIDPQVFEHALCTAVSTLHATDMAHGDLHLANMCWDETARCLTLVDFDTLQRATPARRAADLRAAAVCVAVQAAAARTSMRTTARA